MMRTAQKMYGRNSIPDRLTRKNITFKVIKGSP